VSVAAACLLLGILFSAICTCEPWNAQEAEGVTRKAQEAEKRRSILMMMKVSLSDRSN
jgi:hypothetical protein